MMHNNQTLLSADQTFEANAPNNIVDLTTQNHKSEFNRSEFLQAVGKQQTVGHNSMLVTPSRASHQNLEKKFTGQLSEILPVSHHDLNSESNAAGVPFDN